MLKRTPRGTAATYPLALQGWGVRAAFRGREFRRSSGEGLQAEFRGREFGVYFVFPTSSWQIVAYRGKEQQIAANSNRSRTISASIADISICWHARSYANVLRFPFPRETRLTGEMAFVGVLGSLLASFGAEDATLKAFKVHFFSVTFSTSIS